jgi:hypothetical protein
MVLFLSRDICGVGPEVDAPRVDAPNAGAPAAAEVPAPDAFAAEPPMPPRAVAGVLVAGVVAGLAAPNKDAGVLVDGVADVVVA